MHFNQYQKIALSTRVYDPARAIIYPALKLNGEAGEVAEKVGKVLRDNDGLFTTEIMEAIALELGDVLWYISSLAVDLGYSLQDIAEMNLEKLADRRGRGVIHGSGDNR